MASTQIDASAPPRRIAPDAAPRRFTFAVAAMLLLADLGFVAAFGSRVPYWDEWELVPVFTGARPLSLDWLWAQHNEHRIPIARLLLLGIYRISNYDLRAGMVFNVLALGGLAFGCIAAARALRGRASYADVLLPLLWLHWGHCYNLLMGWQVVFMVPLLLVGTVLILIARYGSTATTASTIGIGVATALLPLSGGIGLAFLPALVIWLGITAFLACEKQPRQAFLRFLFVVVAAISAAVYLIGYQKPAGQPRPSSWLDCLPTAIQFLSMSLGEVYRPLWWIWAAIVLALIVAAVRFAWSWLRDPAEGTRALGLLAVLAGVCCLSLAIGWGRAGYRNTPGMGGLPGLLPRYACLGSLGIVACYFILVRYGPGQAWARMAPVIIAGAIAALLINTVEGLAYGRKLSSDLQPFERDIQAGVPPIVLGDRYSRPPAWLHPRRDFLAQCIRDLYQGGWGIFKQARPDPDLAAVPIKPQPNSEPDSLRFQLPAPRQVDAVRLFFAYGPPAGMVPFRMIWQRLNGSPRQLEVILPRRPAEDSVILWVDDRLQAFSLQPGPGGRVRDIELLVPR